MDGYLDYLKNMIGMGSPPPPANDWPTNAPIQQNTQPVHQMAPQNVPSQQQMDSTAHSKGFGNAAQMAAFYQRQREQQPGSAASNGHQSLLDQALAIHPAYLLSHVLDAWNKADGTTP